MRVAEDISEISETVPRRRNQRDVDRVAVLLLAGTGADLGSLRQGQLINFTMGVDLGRRPPINSGRTPVALVDRTVSGYHARIDRLSDGYVITDQGSTNGTMVDGRAVVEPTRLREGAVLFLGAQVLIFRTVTPAELAAIESELSSPFAPVPTLSPALATICAKLKLLAPSTSEILLLGETGVGKEVFAGAIHARSGRRGQLVAINCAALPRELVESELFGYERGAHSTAKARKSGLIELADGGTLFLDELGEMPLDVQSKLLRFIQDRTYFPIGSTRSQTADVRIIAASSRSAGSGMPAIQEALLGRLGSHPVELPPLRDRPEDIGRLVAHFIAKAPRPRPFEAEAFQALFLYRWPNNVRELQKTVEEAEVLSRANDAISFDHLPPAIVQALERADSADGDDASVESADDAGADEASNGVPRAISERNDTSRRVRRPAPQPEELRGLLAHYRGNVAHVARHLGRQWAVVWRMLQRFGIDPAEFRPRGEGGIDAGVQLEPGTEDGAAGEALSASPEPDR